MKISNKIKSINIKNKPKPSISITGRIAVVALSLTVIGLPLAYLLHKHLKGRVQTDPPGKDNIHISSIREKVLRVTEDKLLNRELERIVELGSKYLHEEPSPLKRFKRKNTGLHFSITPVAMGTDKLTTGFIAHAKGNHGIGSFGKCKKAYLFVEKDNSYDVKLVNLKIGRRDSKSKYKFGHLAKSENIKTPLFASGSTERIEQKAMAVGLINPKTEFTLTPLYQSDLKNHTPKNIDEVIQIGKDLCEGLQFIHNQKKMHCDVKPANVLMDNKGRATLIDHDFVTSSESKPSSLNGTPAYMAPETRDRYVKKQLTASDMFALGLIFLELRGKVLESAAKQKGLGSIANEITKNFSPHGDNFKRILDFQHNDYLINDRDLLAYALTCFGKKEGQKVLPKLLQLESLIKSLLQDYKDRPTAGQAFRELSSISG